MEKIILQQRLDSVPARDPMEIIQEAIELYEVDCLWGLFSGGTDSLVATYWASKHPLFRGVISVDTTIAISETHDYIRQTCEAMSWKLLMVETPNNWGWLSCKFGMLGPAYHQMAYINLKERAFMKARKQIKDMGFDRIGFVSGARRSESARRSRNVEYHHREGAIVWINAISDYLDVDKRTVMTDEKLTQSEVSKRICMSGDCLCGTTFEHEKEKRIEIKKAYPDAELKIQAGEHFAKVYNKPDRWAERPNKAVEGLKPDQPNLFLPLCSDCQGS